MKTCFSSSHFSFCHLCLQVFLALFHFCSSNQISDQVLCLEGERQALLSFKHDLVDTTDRLASWVAEDTECCRWAGIACDNSTRHVHEIHLRGLDGLCSQFNYDTDKEYEEAAKWRLKGDISPSLVDLKELEYLDLSCNDFEENHVPQLIGSLQNLRYLNLSYSNLSGVIPPKLGNLSELRVLSLGSGYDESKYASMKNMQWLSSLGKLHHLDMGGIYFDKGSDWLHVINTLPSLVELHLPNCVLLNTRLHVPGHNLSSLSLLDLSLSRFDTSLVSWIFSITSLVSLDLSGCFLNYDIPDSVVHSFRNLSSLKFLKFAGNDFMGSSLVLKELSSSNIVSLDISSCGVSSSLLENLANLTSLRSLDLSSNQLTKMIPKSLGNLCNLREVDLSYNNIGNISLTYLLESFLECKSPPLESLSLSENYIDGIIPHSIGQLSFLRSLDLSSNQISGPIPFSVGRLSSLEWLYLQYNQLNGSLPNGIGRLSSLKKLDLSYNQLDGTLPYSLGQLSKLVYLDLSYNLLMGIVTESHFVKLISLNYLDGTSNNLTFRLQATNWTSPFQLEYLSLKSWVLGPRFPSWLQSQKNLTQLDISNTHISSAMPESFLRSFPNLRYLNISHNHIQGMLTSSIPATLEVVDLSNNELWGSLHHFLCSNKMKNTRQLILGNNHLSGAIPECLGRWPSLVVLSLENNNLSGGIPRTLGSIPNLAILNMRGNKISGRLPTSLMNLTGLQILQLGKNELVGSIPAWIGTKLNLLILVNLRSNYFDGSIPHELCYLTSVQILDLAHNNLSGNIPRCFNNFTVFSGIQIPFPITFGYETSIVGDALVIKGREDTYSTILRLVMLLDLSSNNLLGDFPSEITSLVELQSLNLSRNQLTGRIPQNIGDMKELTSFDLSLNKLSGELPLSLSRLSFLSSFNVSYNILTGRIPQSTQIQSLNESSFFGNKLCGAPLTGTNDCAPVEVPRDTIGDERNEGDGRDWGFIISIMIGFATGFWVILAPLMVSTSWRIIYFGLLNKLRYMIYDVLHKYCCGMHLST
ncbi:hypothetical protein SSX86_010216 [Deinandra increscens subsp. villosa]|uniref:Leucine-rich repeat-containing N-terminal plant-type domain-containing protein n=1 Tax=Deinandra increscens subsp. villosa TaxID=3103831 RepID=A0AAP0D751_9ASTR